MKLHQLTVSATADDGSLITPRCGHSANLIDVGPASGPTIFLFGGASHEQGPMSDGWMLELQGSQFLSHLIERRRPAVVEGSRTAATAALTDPSQEWPLDRYEHCAVNIDDEKCTLLFGGSGALEGRLMNDLWRFDWQRKTIEPVQITTETVPPGRTLQYAACIRNRQTGRLRIFLWSGGAEAGKPVEDDRMWIFEVQSRRWIGLPATATTAASPPLRQGHSIIGWQQYLIVFGGLDAGGESLNDLWLYDTERNQWTELTGDKSNWPSGRSGHAATLLQSRWLAISGGLSLRQSTSTTSTTTSTTTTTTTTDNNNNNNTATVLSDLWLFDLQKRQWQQLVSPPSSFSGGNQRDPLERFSHRIVPLSISDRDAFVAMSRHSVAGDEEIDGKLFSVVDKLLMIGGMNLQGVFNDFWLVDPWTAMAGEDEALIITNNDLTESSVTINQLIQLEAGSGEQKSQFK